jgi:hypothetical protein
MDARQLRSISKDEVPFVAKCLDEGDIRFLVECLAVKDGTTRYHAFLLLQASSREFPHVYRWWDLLAANLESDARYQRSVGVMLIAENVRWDTDRRFAKILDTYLRCCVDTKFITARQAIQGLAIVITATSAYNDAIKLALAQFPFGKYKETQHKLLKKDITEIQALID